MKKVEAIIKPFKLDEVKDKLHEIGIQESRSPKSRALAAKKDTLSSIAGPNTSLIFSPKLN